MHLPFAMRLSPTMSLRRRSFARPTSAAHPLTDAATELSDADAVRLARRDPRFAEADQFLTLIRVGGGVARR